jgi:hypothetical protein
MSTFFDGVYHFITEETDNSSQELQNVKILFSTLLNNAQKFSQNPSIHLYYGYTGTGEVSAEISKLLDQTKKRLSDLSIFSEIEISIIGASPLQEIFRRASETSQASFIFANKTTLPEHPKVNESYLGFIPANELIDVVAADEQKTKINRKLFFDNVRDFDPDSDVNKSIEQSISEESSGFVFRNNGITIVARDGRPTGNNFFIKDFQIVNGCQTSNIVFRNKDKVLGVNIPLRLIISDDNDFINTIIVGTNKQNPVRDEQFWALKPFAKDFEEYARSQSDGRELFYERRENQYRFDEVSERTRIIDSATVVKSVVAMFMELPNRAGRDYRQMKSEFADRIFLTGHDVRIYHAAAYAFYKLEFLYRTNRIDKDLKRFRMYILWSIAKKFSPKDGDILSLGEKKVSDFTLPLLDFLDNVTALIGYINDFIRNYENELKARGQSSDRDALRSEEAMVAARNALNSVLELK